MGRNWGSVGVRDHNLWRMMGTNYPLDHTTAQPAVVKVAVYQRL